MAEVNGTDTIQIDPVQERKALAREYRALLKNSKRVVNEADKLLLRKAFDLAVEAHQDDRRKSGEAYIFHPIAVARIVSEEIGLGTTSIVCALLHDVVEDTEITLDDIESIFGERVRVIIDGLTKLKGAHFGENVSMQAENFRKMLLTLSDDVRVILIKLADRLHNMRTLDSMRPDKQQKIASETLYLYAPLAHRLGLYNIKSELEDLCLKYKEAEVYQEIERSLKKSKAVRTRFINRFVVPIKRGLEEAGLEFEIKSRTKSIHSIYNKMLTKNIPLEEIYDVFAIRIILKSDDEEREKSDCWKAYSVVTDYYKPNPDRLRDWISTPKSNGYESLHTTVMSPSGKWVEVQIRTKRMDEIAEMGYAAHWKYKESASEHALDEWINRIRETLQDPDPNALAFIDDFKLNLFSKEIFVFTPKGELRNFPQEATALDFAFEIHTEVGAKCIGAKVNHKLVPLSTQLKSGDQVEILTSSKQKPKEDWLRFVVTAKAKSNIKNLLKEERKRVAEDGKEILIRKLRSFKIDFNENNLRKIQNFFRFTSAQELFYKIGKEELDLSKLANLKKEKGQLKYRGSRTPRTSIRDIVKNIESKEASLVIGDNVQNLEYKLANCCNPIPGDNIFGFITVNDGIKIHRQNCPNAIQLMSNYAYRIIKAKWTNAEVVSFLAAIRITGIDQVGLVNDVTKVISSEYHVNMRSISFDTDDGIFEGTIKVYVNDTTHLTELMRKLRNIDGVRNVSRIKGEQSEPEITKSN